MTFSLYDTQKRQKVEFQPLKSGHVKMYVCGPTVYDRAHLGNARPMVVFDTLFRLLKLDHKVTYVRNITDIDDKIIDAALRQNQTIEDLTQSTVKHFHQDMAALNVLPPSHEPFATHHMDDMIAMIERLIAQDYAYVSEGHVLFAVKKLPQYGCLSGCQQDDIMAGARIEVAAYKRDAADFVLWKPSNETMPGWTSPWGRGRPGWHIECSAMIWKLLGEKFDIHGGGQDLIFPHHENEIAQSTALFGAGSFAQHWLHNGILNVNGTKMSKSLGNFIVISDLLMRAPGEVIRFAILSTHYRQPLDWNDRTLNSARHTMDRLYRAIKFDVEMDQNEDADALATSEIDAEFLSCLKDDLNTPAAIARLHQMVHAIHQCSEAVSKVRMQVSLKKSAQLLGIFKQDPQAWFQSDPNVHTDISLTEIEASIDARNQARQNRDFNAADQVRQRLLDQGIVLEDTPQGTTWRRLSS